MAPVTHRPFLWIALGFCGGIALEKSGVVPLWAWAPALLSVLALALVPRWRRESFVFLLVSVCACAGAMALRSYTGIPSEHIFNFVGRYAAGEMEFECRVVSEVEHQAVGVQRRTRFTAEALALSSEGFRRKVSGRLQATVFRDAAIDFGDELLLSGGLLRPSSFGGRGRASYIDTLASRKVTAAFNVKKKGRCEVLLKDRGSLAARWAFSCRVWLNSVFERYLSEGEAGLIKGLITGDRKGIAPHVKEIFLRTGTTHLLAVSGLNVAMVSFGILFVLSMLPVPRAIRALCAILLTAWYACVAGGSSPVVRSAVMSAVFMMSFMIEREQETLNTLAVASMAILVVNPAQLFDVGFQLSFVGVLSLVLIGPIIAGLFPDGKGARFWNEYLGVSIAAFLGTTGIVAFYFGTMTPVSLLANIPAVPLVALITALGAILLLLSGIPVLASVVALALKAALNFLVFILYLFTLIPGGFFYLDEIPALWQALMYYACLLVLIFLARRGRRVHPAWAIGL